MHTTSALYLCIILAAAIALFKASEAWWSQQEQGRIKERIAELRAALAESERHSWVQSFLLTIGGVLDRLYGERVFSFRSFFRVQFTTLVIYVVALAVIGLRAGVPFSMKNPPWQGFDYSFDLLEGVYTTAQQTLRDQAIQNGNVVPPYDSSWDVTTKRWAEKWTEQWTMEQASKEDQLEKSEQARALLKEMTDHWWAKIRAYRTEKFRNPHSILCLVFAVFLSGLEAFIGFGICRKLLRDLTVLRTFSHALSVIICTALLFFILRSVAILLLTLAAIPVTFKRCRADSCCVFGTSRHGWDLSYF